MTGGERSLSDSELSEMIGKLVLEVAEVRAALRALCCWATGKGKPIPDTLVALELALLSNESETIMEMTELRKVAPIIANLGTEDMVLYPPWELPIFYTKEHG